MIPMPKNTKDNPNAKIVLVTPSVARQWLDYNGFNRPLNQKVVDVYVRLMERGYWKPCVGSISFSPDRLIDGQHRLFAIVKSGCECEMNVFLNQDPESHKTIDNHKPRTCLDILRQALLNHTIKAEEIRVLKALLAGRFCKSQCCLMPIELIEPFCIHQKRIKEAIAALGPKEDVTVLGVFARAGYKVDAVKLLEFADAYREEATRPIVVFRQFLRLQTDRKESTRREIYKRFEFTIDAFLNGRNEVSYPNYWDEFFPLSSNQNI